MSKIKILHIEDVSTDADLVARILRKANIDFDTQVVDDREAYTQALKDFNPDIVLSDHGLPEFNSIEAMDILKESGLKIPFILVTGAVSEEFAIVALKKGADDYILKDRLQRLPIAVATSLKKYQLEREQIRTGILLQNIDNNSPDIICSFDAESKFLHASAAALNIWGYAPSELVGRKFTEFIFNEDLEAAMQIAQLVASNTPISMFENRYVHKNGHLVPMLWSARWDNTEQVMYCIARDASEKKRMELELKTEQQRFIDLFLEAPAAVGILTGPEHAFHIFNPLFEQFTGRKNIVGKTAIEAFPELESQGLIKLLDKVYTSGQSVSREEVLLKINRKEKPIEIYCNYVCKPYKNAKGETEGVFFFAVDVTPQVIARKKIAAEKMLSDSIINSLPGVFFLFNANGEILRWNKNFETVSGYNNDEIQNMHPLDFFEESTRPLLKSKIENALKVGAEEIDIAFTTKRGSTIPYYYTARATQFEDEPCLIGLGFDISERKKIEEENHKLSLIASLTVNSVVITDSDRKIIWVNSAFEKITEYTQVEVLGKKPGTFLQGKETNPDTIKYMRKRLNEGKGFRVEILNYSKSGRKYWLDIEAKPLHDDQNRLTGFMAIQQDITDRKKTEKETLELVNSLQKKNSDLQQFSYIISHNLRAPIARMLGLANIFDSKPEDNNFIVEQLAKEASSLDEIVRDINLIISIRDAEIKTKEAIMLEPKLKSMLVVLESEINESKANITFDFSAAPEVHTIKTYLYSIIYNLLSNAIKFRAKHVPLKVHLKSTQDEKFVCLEISDNGSGIDLQANGEKLFDLYKRFHDQSIPGKGIGLNLVKTQVESLGGRVEVESEVDKGSTFKVYLPKIYEAERKD